MRENMRETLNTEITRKQFLQFSAGALLMVFGLHNILSLLSGNKTGHQALTPMPSDGREGFGSRRFGT